jgi:hypothetical protein
MRGGARVVHVALELHWWVPWLLRGWWGRGCVVRGEGGVCGGGGRGGGEGGRGGGAALSLQFF